MNQFLVVILIMLWILVIFNLLLTLALIRRSNIGTPSKASEVRRLANERLFIGQTAPDFSARTIDGEQVALSTYTGHWIAFLFISTSCTMCKDLIPTIKALAPKAALSGVDLILVSGDDDTQTRNFIEEFHIDLPVLTAPQESNDFLKHYKSLRTPSYCLLDDHGRVQAADRLTMDSNEWKKLVEAWEGNTSNSVDIISNKT